MKILIDTYNTALQAKSGGVRIKIEKYIEHISRRDIEIEYFNKWNTNINDFDLIHIIGLNIEHYNLVRYAKSNNIPIIISSILPYENIFKRKFLLFLKIFKIKTKEFYIYNMLKMGNCIITETSKEANYIKRLYKINNNKIKVIPNGVKKYFELDYNDSFLKKYNLPAEYILCVGRFDKNKNQLNLIKALNLLKCNAVFIGGAYPGQTEYYEECKKIANDKIVFTDWIEHDSQLFISAYQNAKIIVLPSLQEILGNSVIEGAIFGCNIVISKNLSVVDWINKKKYYKVLPRKVTSILKNLRNALIDEKDYSSCKRIYDYFCWDRIISEHMEIYEKSINKNI